MGKAKVRKKLEGYKKQLKKHIEKFKEAEDRGAVESMGYMARELSGYLKMSEIFHQFVEGAINCFQQFNITGG